MTLQRTPPGYSADRTPGKHDLLDWVASKLAGASTTQKVGAQAIHFIDLCAGHGEPESGWSFWDGTSPGILIHRAGQVAHKLLATVELYEIKRTVFDRLIASLTLHLGCEPSIDTDRVHTFKYGTKRGGVVVVRAIPGSGSDARVDHIGPNTCVLVNNDPNTIHKWAMRQWLTAEILRRTWMCTTISTMGCNVGGLLRMSLEERLKWYRQVQSVRATVAARTDIALAAIDSDPARWAYLVTSPLGWVDQTEGAIRSAFRKINREMRVEWLRRSPDAFNDLEDLLFLRNNERDQGGLW